MSDRVPASVDVISVMMYAALLPAVFGVIALQYSWCAPCGISRRWVEGTQQRLQSDWRGLRGCMHIGTQYMWAAEGYGVCCWVLRRAYRVSDPRIVELYVIGGVTGL